MECFNVEFVSPERRLDFADVYSLSARTPTGALTVMAHHERALMDLLSGEVVLKNASGVLDVIMVSNAVMSIGDNTCAIMADMVLLSKDGAEDKLKNVRDVMSKATPSDGILGELARVDLEFIDRVLKG
ncbi:ATP synthase subunit epsilon [Anaplasma centrale]|nr:ATP synthase subunit epsilon [Anaplasma centrale]